jgi:hypothetical protein
MNGSTSRAERRLDTQNISIDRLISPVVIGCRSVGRAGSGGDADVLRLDGVGTHGLGGGGVGATMTLDDPFVAQQMV